jgi:hypothetical protein
MGPIQSARVRKWPLGWLYAILLLAVATVCLWTIGGVEYLLECNTLNFGPGPGTTIQCNQSIQILFVGLILTLFDILALSGFALFAYLKRPKHAESNVLT